MRSFLIAGIPDAFKDDCAIDGPAGLGEMGHIGAAAQQVFFFETKSNELDRPRQHGPLEPAGDFEKHGEVCPANWKPGDASIDTKNAKAYFEKAAK